MLNQDEVKRFHFLGSDGFTHSAVAISEQHARTVIESEQPAGLHLGYVESTYCRVGTLASRRQYLEPMRG